MLAECHKELDAFTTEHQSNVYNQPNDIEMSNTDDNGKVDETNSLCLSLGSVSGGVCFSMGVSMLIEI